MLGQLGMHPEHLIPRNLYLKNEMDITAVAHQAGTCRFGTDPATSVLDVNCKAHELDNLYVVDTSFFPSIGAVNPGLTAMANALRVGDHLRQRLAAVTAPSAGGGGAGGDRRRLRRRSPAGAGAGDVPGRERGVHQPRAYGLTDRRIRPDVRASGRVWRSPPRCWADESSAAGAKSACFLAGLAANLASMALLVGSRFAQGAHAVAYAALADRRPRSWGSASG